MAVFETFHERQQKLRGDLPDVYVYDYIPMPLRVQIVQIMEEVLGDQFAYANAYSDGSVPQGYKLAVDELRKAIGVFRLPPTSEWENEDYRAELRAYLLTEPNVEWIMSAVELICRVIERVASRYGYRRINTAAEKSVEAIADINARLKQHGVGYEYNGEIIRIDSELVHAETVKPALTLLRNKAYVGAHEEFLRAYEHYRMGRNKEAITEAAKSFESVMKIILDKRRWSHSPDDPAKKLIEALYANGLIPAFWQNHFTGLRQMLENAIPTPRNKNSAHGQGTIPTTVPDHMAGYILHMTASTIVFLVSAEKTLP